MYPATGSTGNRSTPILSVSCHSRSESPRRVKSRTHGWLLRRLTLFCPRPSSVSWPTAQIIRDVAKLRTLKGQPGKNMYVVGGATLVASLLNEDLIDELRLIVHPIVQGKGQALFSGVNNRLSLDLVQAKSTESGRVVVTYRT
jgi:dihydrofolate reductase